MDAEGEDGRDDRDGHGQGIDSFRAVEERVGDSSGGGAGDGCHLEGAGVPGDGVGEVFFGNQMRQDGAAYRKIETAEDTEQNEDDVDRDERSGARAS